MGLDSVELILDVEREFGIEIGDAEAAELTTVGDLLACITRNLVPGAEAPPDVCPRLVRLLASSSGVKPERIDRNTGIVRDLGID